MLKLSDQEKQEIIRYLEADKPLPEKCRFLLFEDKRQTIRVQNPETGASEEQRTGDFIFENACQIYHTEKDRSLDLKSVTHECSPGRHKIAVKVVDIFGNDTMTIVEATV